MHSSCLLSRNNNNRFTLRQNGDYRYEQLKLIKAYDEALTK